MFCKFSRLKKFSAAGAQLARSNRVLTGVGWGVQRGGGGGCQASQVSAPRDEARV